MKPDGQRTFHWALKENYWDPEAKAQRQRHIAYIGKEPILTLAKAKAICEAKGLTLEQLQAVKGLRIVPDAQTPKRQRSCKN